MAQKCTTEVSPVTLATAARMRGSKAPLVRNPRQAIGFFTINVSGRSRHRIMVCRGTLMRGGKSRRPGAVVLLDHTDQQSDYAAAALGKPLCRCYGVRQGWADGKPASNFRRRNDPKVDPRVPRAAHPLRLLCEARSPLALRRGNDWLVFDRSKGLDKSQLLFGWFSRVMVQIAGPADPNWPANVRRCTLGGRPQIKCRPISSDEPPHLLAPSYGSSVHIQIYLDPRAMARALRLGFQDLARHCSLLDGLLCSGATPVYTAVSGQEFCVLSCYRLGTTGPGTTRPVSVILTRHGNAPWQAFNAEVTSC